MKIITQQLADKLPKDHKLLYNKIVNPQNYSALHSALIETQQLIIYDITTNKKYPLETIIGVNDHINRTGENPLIGGTSTWLYRSYLRFIKYNINCAKFIYMNCWEILGFAII